MNTAQNTLITKVQTSERVASSIGMAVLLISFSMLFLTLFMGYAVYRLTANVWPPLGMDQLPSFQAHISTSIILISSISFYLFQEKKILPYLYTALLMGLLFVFSQFQLWSTLKVNGIYAGSGIFASIIYGYTWTHAAHILLGLIGLLSLVFRVNKVNFLQQEGLVINIGKFWHFLAVVWLIIYALIFVI
ncbi:MAG: cytochrome c oxidase subunit 3 [Halobacteriovoraceae bacterium]|nr:cytochrome c oxidase subunit 3 [Halobacteriovoraceae bacterium]